MSIVTTFDALQASVPVVPAVLHVGRNTQCGTFLPAADGPMIIILGSLTPATEIYSLARRHSLDPLALERFAREGDAA